MKDNEGGRWIVPIPDNNYTLGRSKIAVGGVYLPQTSDISLSMSVETPFGTALPERLIARIDFSTTAITEGVLALLTCGSKSCDFIYQEFNPVGRNKRIQQPHGVLTGARLSLQDPTYEDNGQWQRVEFSYVFDAAPGFIQMGPKEAGLTDTEMAEIVGLDAKDADEWDDFLRTDLMQVCKGAWRREPVGRTWYFAYDPEDESWMDVV